MTNIEEDVDECDSPLTFLEPFLSSTASLNCKTMTVDKEGNSIPLLNKISRKALKRQWAQQQESVRDTRVTFSVNENEAHNRKLSRTSAYTRSDSLTERYVGAGDTGNVRKYKLPLLQMVEEDHYEDCKKLLENSKTLNINEADKETGCTALHLSAKNNSYDILKLLLDKQADCNVQDKTEETPLHIAVKKNHIHCAQLLLECENLKINNINKSLDTPLHYAAKEGRDEICQMILNHKDVKINAKNKKGTTALHYAAQEDQSSILRLLLDHGAVFDKPDNHSYLALHYAAQKGYQDCCKILLDVNDIDRQKQLKKNLKDGKSPLILAAKGGHHRCCDIMGYVNINVADKEGNTAIHYAASGGYDYTVIQLLQASGNPNTKNKKSITPVLEAAGKKKYGCLKILAEHGANLSVFDNQGKNVLHYTAEKNSLDIMRFLLTYPVIVSLIDRKDMNSYAPLHLAIKKEADACALLLLETGASPVEKCKGEMTPLHLAADKGSTSICEFLLSKKEVQVSQENELKATPLHMAALHGSTDVCQMLIRKGARLTAVDDTGKTALHIASTRGHVNVVKFLSKKGIPLKARDESGSCALHIAASKGFLECCQVLVSCAKASCWEMDQNGNLPIDRAFKENDDSNLTQETLEEHDQVFSFLLKNLCYKEKEDRKLKIHTYMDKALLGKRHLVIEAIIDSCWWRAGISGRNGHQCQNFRELIKSYPCIAQKIQNKCITRCKETGSEVTYDFTVFEDNYYVPSVGNGVQLATSPFDPKTYRVAYNALPFTTDGLKWKDSHPVSLMISHGRQQLLQHSLVKTWLWQKWSSYIYIIFLILLLIEILFAIVLACFMGFTNNWIHIGLDENCCMNRTQFCNMSQSSSKPSFPAYDFNITSGNSTNDSSFLETLNISSEFPSMSNDMLEDKLQFESCLGNIFLRRCLWGALLTLTCITILLECNYAYRLRNKYIYQAEHMLQVLRMFFTLFILIPGGLCEFDNMILNVYHWQCGIIALLLTWLHLINGLNQLPMLSVFMPVTLGFVKSFFKVVFYIVMIVFIFAFIFHLLLKDQSAFSTVPQAMVKTIVWMLGDLAYDDTFLTDDFQLYYPIMVNCLFVVFVTILGGFIANLVVTQPANKLDNFRDQASFHRAASRTELFLKLDICFPFFRKHRTVGAYVDDEAKKVDYSFLSKKLLMLDHKEETSQTEEVDPTKLELEELKNQISTFMSHQAEQREEVKELKHQINFLIKNILELKQS